MNDTIRLEAQRLLAAMTRDEKIDLVHGVDFMWTRGVPRLGVRKLHMADASMGLRDDAIPATQAEGVSTTVKHFAANNSDWHRCCSNSVVDERTLRELYLPAFETTVTLDRRAFAFFDVARQDWVVEPGEFRILVGASSSDIRMEGELAI